MAFTTKRKWYSSRKHFSSCIYRLARETFERVSEMMQTASVLFLSNATFYKIQKTLIIPAIDRFFTAQRQLLYADAQELEKIDVSVIMQNMVRKQIWTVKQE